MTLPFRRRHHDDDSAHDRARALTSNEMLEPLAETEATWLARHLDGCADCRLEREAMAADRELLRGLRERTPEPPRDLWARTAAKIDREAARQPRVAGAPARPSRRAGGWRGAPLGAATGALIVLILVGTTFLPDLMTPNATTPGTPGGSQGAVSTPLLAPTPLQIPGTDPVTWIQTAADGTVTMYTSAVDEVCPQVEPRCRPQLTGGPGQTLNLGGRPATVTISPTSQQLVVESPGDEVLPGKIFIVAVPTSGPGSTPLPTIDVTPPPSSEEPSIDPSAPPPTPDSTPPGGVEILSDVTVVGDVAYSPDGTWLAFSAQPGDGSTGPDLYLWTAGLERAYPVTTDHQTYFSAWLGDQVLASTAFVAPAEVPLASGAPVASAAPGASAEPAGEPVAPIEAHPVSFLLDPVTQARTALRGGDVWLPVVDKPARFVTYWAGTLLSADGGLTWQPDKGDLVLDAWQSAEPAPSDPATAPATAPPASGDPATDPEPVIGPAGSPTKLVPGKIMAFKARFDPDGTRIAIWTAEHADDSIGRLHLLVLDPELGTIESKQPLPGVQALARFSLENGRLAWVSPRGQDGKESAVQVLGWRGNDFGEIETLPARDLYIVH